MTMQLLIFFNIFENVFQKWIQIYYNNKFIITINLQKQILELLHNVILYHFVSFHKHVVIKTSLLIYYCVPITWSVTSFLDQYTLLQGIQVAANSTCFLPLTLLELQRVPLDSFTLICWQFRAVWIPRAQLDYKLGFLYGNSTYPTHPTHTLPP